MASKALKTVLALVLVAGIAAASSADCRQFFRAQVFHQQAIIAQPVVLYQAGRDVELDALAERVAQRIEARLSQRAPAGDKQSIQAPLTEPPAAPALAMAQHCAKCHSGAKPKAQLVFDGETQLECWHITKALRAIRDDKMPKDHGLTPEQKGQIMEELLSLEHQAQPAAPVEGSQ